MQPINVTFLLLLFAKLDKIHECHKDPKPNTS
jgi:hypothetical protein